MDREIVIANLNRIGAKFLPGPTRVYFARFTAHDYADFADILRPGQKLLALAEPLQANEGLKSTAPLYWVKMTPDYLSDPRFDSPDLERAYWHELGHHANGHSVNRIEQAKFVMDPAEWVRRQLELRQSYEDRIYRIKEAQANGWADVAQAQFKRTISRDFYDYIQQTPSIDFSELFKAFRGLYE